VVWDGVDDRGAVVVTPNMYFITIRGCELPDNAIVVTGNKPVITGVAADPNYFSAAYNPYNTRSSQQTRVSFSLSRTADLEVRVIDGSGAVVRIMDKPGLSAGAGSLTWDGKDQSGNPVFPGSYSIALTAVDDAGNRSLTRYAVVMLND
jgi:flagellar hook assembly protein FlgD